MPETVIKAKSGPEDCFWEPAGVAVSVCCEVIAEEGTLVGEVVEGSDSRKEGSLPGERFSESEDVFSPTSSKAKLFFDIDILAVHRHLVHSLVP